jgi:PAS domain S-box-containing protein
MDVDAKNSAPAILKDLLRLFDGMGDGIMVTDRFGEIVGINKALATIFGIDNDVELRENPTSLFNGLCNPETKQRVHPQNLPFNRAIHTGHTVDAKEFLLKRSDSSECFVKISTSPVFEDEGLLVGTIGVVTDITDWKRLEETVAERNLQLTAINRIAAMLGKMIDFREILEYSLRQMMSALSCTSGAIFLSDKNGQRIYLGASVNLEESLLSRIHGSEIHSTIFGKVFELGIIQFVGRSAGFQGTVLEELPFDAVVVFPLKWNGKVVGVGALFNEVERTPGKYEREVIEGIGTVMGTAIENSVLYEEVIHKTRLLESKDRELEQVVHAITHDLKSPLLAIESFTLELRRGGALGIEQEALVEAILSSSTKLHSLVNNLIELESVGRNEAAPEETDIALLVRNVVDGFYTRLTERKIKVSMEGDFPKLYIAAQHIERVFINLIDNAIKYIGNRTDPCITIGVHDKGDHFLFYVRDNGIGIAREFQEKIFEIFQRVKASETETIEGVGLGLAFAKKIVDVNGGQMWVESRGRGKGATFYFTLPKQY